MDHQGRIAALEPVGDDDRDGAAHQRRMPGHRQEFIQEAPIMVPPSKSKTISESRLSAVSGLRCFKVAGHPRKPRPKAEGLDLRRPAGDEMRETQCKLGMRFHRTGNVDQEKQATRPLRPGLAHDAERFAERAPRRAGRPGKVDPRAACRRDPAAARSWAYRPASRRASRGHRDPHRPGVKNPCGCADARRRQRCRQPRRREVREEPVHRAVAHCVAPGRLRDRLPFRKLWLRQKSAGTRHRKSGNLR